MKLQFKVCPVIAAVAGLLAGAVHASADVVTDWNATLSAAIAASGEAPPVAGRKAAIVQAAVYDAVNGIVRKYEPYFVDEWAPGGARPEAAAVQAAYTTLVAMYPAQKPMFDAQLAATLPTIPGIQGKSQSIARGFAWGEAVAEEILAWRSGGGSGVEGTHRFGKGGNIERPTFNIQHRTSAPDPKRCQPRSPPATCLCGARRQAALHDARASSWARRMSREASWSGGGSGVEGTHRFGKGGNIERPTFNIQHRTSAPDPKRCQPRSPPATCLCGARRQAALHDARASTWARAYESRSVVECDG